MNSSLETTELLHGVISIVSSTWAVQCVKTSGNCTPSSRWILAQVLLSLYGDSALLHPPAHAHS